jgi:high-affinity Fe2+/Pb2+ permease
MDEQQTEERAMAMIFAVAWIMVIAAAALGVTVVWLVGQ